MNRRLADAIVEAGQLAHIPADHGRLWDCPGHVNVPDGSSDFHFAVLPHDALEPHMENEYEEPGPETQPAVNIYVA